MKAKKYKSIETKVSFPKIEEKIIKYWKKEKIFEESIETRPENKKWTFLDGPPFITGLPHYGSLLSSIPKDVFPRFYTMNGHKVRRVWGWDCHGLPAENKVENQFNIKRKKDIEEKVGVGRFIAECKKYVSQVSEEWEWYVDHIGRWVDFTNSYKTMDLSYMESVMWIFKKMYEKGYIYKGLRVSLYCPHCATPISNFEVAMDADNYKEITESATVYKYQLKGQENTYILAWSTTPWNKIVTPALAVNPKLTYVYVKQEGETLVLAQDTLKILKDVPYKIVKKTKGKDIIGLKFVPHYNFYRIEKGKNAFEIIGGDFVSSDEGTGVVTIAAYGEDDLRAMQENNIQVVMHLDEDGNLKGSVPNWGGMYYLKVNKKVNQDLKDRGLIYRDDPYTHTVSTCWRCHTRLIHAPQNAWYVDIQKLKPKLIANNKKVNWFPKHFKFGRFLKSVEAAPDWCISRSRYWGSPVPVWECECGERYVFGSINELMHKSGQKINDLHKPDIDEVKIKCDKCGKYATRVPEVLDSWIEAGSAYFGERHFPFEKGQNEKHFDPPDFIVEYTGQIRAWFYVLHVIAVSLFDSHAFKNVVVTGVILGSDGRKMSKNFGNYPDPKEMLDKYGGDALRLYLLGSPVMRGEDILISEDQYRHQVRGFLLIFWNVYNFFITYANFDKWNHKVSKSVITKPIDKWIISKLNKMIAEITFAYKSYDTPNAVKIARNFVVNDLSLWYVRRIRSRVGASSDDEKDKSSVYQTLYSVLTNCSKAFAPLIPFVTEEMYLNLTDEKSVHLSLWWDNIDEINQNRDTVLEKNMNHAIKLASAVHSFRKKNQIKVRLPLKSVSYSGPINLPEEVIEIVKSETNVENLNYVRKTDEYKIKASLSKSNIDYDKGLVRELIREIQMLRKRKSCKMDEHINVQLPGKYRKLSDSMLVKVKSETLTKSLIWGKDLKILTG